MKRLTKTTYVLLVILTSFFAQIAIGQSVIDPNDPIVNYDKNNPPTQPAYGQVGKWVRTPRLNWGTDSYKAYIYKGLAFRVKFPKSYNSTVNDGKSYPMIVMFHGAGEAGPITDNEYQLYNGGQAHKNAVDNGTFDGYVVFPQSGGSWGGSSYDFIKEIIDYMIANNKVDPFRVTIHGLSAGGQGVWEMAKKYPNYIAAALPMSWTSIGYKDDATLKNNLKWLQMWNFQGGLDGNPAPGTSQAVRDAMLAVGANYKYTEYPDLGHGTWNRAYAEKDFFPFIIRANKTNPWVLFGRTEFCPGESINVTIGVSPGFSGYQWRKNGVVISGATSNQISATTVGTYDCRILRGSTWSDWSPIPVVIKIKAATVSPNIAISGLASKVIPSPDGSTSVKLEVPDGYETYNWQKVGSSTTLSTTRFLDAGSAGDYKVKVTEQFGCSSDFSDPFTVINANGPNKPDPAINLTVSSISKTQLKLDWSDNPSPVYNETNFEIYMSTKAGGPYKLIALTGADVGTYTSSGLNAGTTYYYIVRAVNNSGAAKPTPEASGTTQADVTAPLAPTNLRIAATSANSITLQWDAAADDVGVTKYDIFINGVRTYNTTGTTFTAFNMEKGKTYAFSVRARDFADNVSPLSNQVTGQALADGLAYKYYTYTGTWTALPNFKTLTPVSTGVMPNVSIADRTQSDNFAYLWEGYIQIPVSGTYTFRLNSDEGSKLYLSKYDYSATALVDNDGTHGARSRDGTITLSAGSYPISVVYFEQTGSQTLTLSWKTPQTGTSFVTVPNSAFIESPSINGQPPVKPSNLVATAVTYKKVNLKWSDNSNNETGFEIWRSTDPLNNFATIGKVGTNTTSFDDTVTSPQTTYYYKIRAIGAYGESNFDREGPGIGYNYYEANNVSLLPDFTTMTPKKSGRAATVGLGMQDRADNFQLKFYGTITIPSTKTYTFYTTSDDGSKLYIDGFDEAHLVVNNDGAHAATEKSGSISLTQGEHDIYVTYFEKSGGESLSVSISASGLTKQKLPASYLGGPLASAKTLALPSSPNAPTNLTATAASSKQIDVSWSFNAVKNGVTVAASSFEVYRSSNNNSNYVLLATVPGNTTTLKDSGLFANATYYYKVRAINEGGPSGYSNEVSETSQNNAPVIADIPNQYMRYGTQLQLKVVATDADPEALTITPSNLPSFASYSNTGNGTGLLTFTTSSANQGTYSNINLTVKDQHGGTSVTTFNLTVNDNYNPALAAVSDVTINEKQTAQVNLSATDQNTGDAISWTFTDLPDFATTTTNGNTAQIKFAPGYADNGRYVVKVKASDDRNGFDTTSFAVIVNDATPSSQVYVNFTDGTYKAPAPWNNTNKVPALNDNFANLADANGSNSGIGLKITSSWQNLGNGTNPSGVNTGNNSGIYPDAVLRGSYWTDGNTQSLLIYGLDPARKYSFTFLGSRGNVSDNRISVYSIDGASVSLNATNNSQNTVSLNNLTPHADGTLPLTLQRASGSAYAYLNSLVIESIYDDHTSPAKPKNLSAQLVTSGKVVLNWTDVAYNEDAYNIYRSESATGPFTLLNPGATNNNTEAYTDNSIGGNKTYYYTVKAKNSYGESAGDVVQIVSPNVPPVLNDLKAVYVKSDQVLNVAVTATDDPGDNVTLSVTGLPSFATFTDNGNGNGVIKVAPSINDLGTYCNITVTATDNKGVSTTKDVCITATNKEINSIYVNFNQSIPAAKPWNNFNTAPYAGKVLSSLSDETDATTNVDVTLVDSWAGVNEAGAVTGANSGVFPDDVMKTAYYDNSNSTKRVRISGLATGSTKYNLVFFSSRDGISDERSTVFSAGGQTVSLNAAVNTTNTVQINGLSANASGQIEVSINQASNSSYSYLNAMVIQSYVDNGTPLTPTSLSAVGKSASAIQLSWKNNAASQSGVEVYRSTTVNGTYSLVTTLAADAVTYTNQGLQPNTIYYYRVKAKDGTSRSNFSNTASAATIAYQVMVNFNQVNPADDPWNNTDNVPQDGSVYANLQNSDLNPSGINLSVVGNDFSGVNPYGMNTGTNSGIYPDNVMRSTWWLDAGGTGTLKIDGLNQAMAYNFVFFASRDGNGNYADRTTVYSIGSKKVSLNAINNTSQTVQINNVIADEDGAVYININAGGASPYAYIGALVVQGLPSATAASGDGSDITPTNTVRLSKNEALVNTLQGAASNAIAEDNIAVQAYPNPFTDDVYLKFNLHKPADKVNILVTDMAGKVIFTKELRSVASGLSMQSLGFNSRSLTPGAYFIRIAGLAADGSVKTLKVIKR